MADTQLSQAPVAAAAVEMRRGREENLVVVVARLQKLLEPA